MKVAVNLSPRQMVQPECDEMQGFLLGRPLTADAFSALMHERMTPSTAPALVN